MGQVRRSLPAAAVLLLLGGGMFTEYGSAGRADAFSLIELMSRSWYGQIGITGDQQAVFIYSNFAPPGAPPVQVEWAFSDARTGEVLLGDYGKPTRVEPMTGIRWELDGAMVAPPGMRRQLIGWLQVTHANKRALARAVDLASVQIVDAMTMQTKEIVSANPIAPGYSLMSAQ